MNQLETYYTLGQRLARSVQRAGCDFYCVATAANKAGLRRNTVQFDLFVEGYNAETTLTEH